MADREWTVELAPGVSAFTAAEWDAMAGTANPFVKHGFLSALEDSGSVGPGTGWQAIPLVVRNENGAPRAALPAYAKGHSQGEYVFDHAWADAWERAGGDYYPKLQISVPFTPATGPRILGDTDLAPALLAAARQVVARHDWSSAHATFIEPAQQALFEDAGWLLRSDIQFHWHNRDYADFDGFLADLASRKRKAIRKERARAVEGLEIVHLTGDEIKAGHWDAFWVFYQDTGARKWGTPYLTRAAFDLFGERMGEDLVLMLALAEGAPVAGALNFIGEDALYGRYWGCTEDRPFLHFELCYYQAIDVAIARGLSRVEAGAQGGHKLARGYEPVETVSAHWMPDPGFRSAVADFLERERAGVETDRMFLGERTPFRKGG
ncbi:GNAT family N-acetyltransferase [Alteriqipengyuania flavescens]|uniref:GNAT family N-acetyltransferase n=1 Tax=Alteriqipengyuania flavescens TaxID=3053610 RepID=UPI0025B61A9A|nr:GNAT family N-acetyltransferase [Alteriqipengyuania flavescens]WJY19429.1 GNAT family N-acetyltransferase [Alteriqipengyuania flavescens]WJY25371.1 GNAT family N-acetyltransferase [Alteriqipengyuania flavescens]